MKYPTVILTTTLTFTLAATGGAFAQMLSPNPYQSLDEKAEHSYTPNGISELVDEILGRVVLGPLAPSLRDRIMRAELAFKSGSVDQTAITEPALADAINIIGRKAGGPLYTGTNALQVRLLRVGMYSEIPHLLYSPTKPQHGDLVGNDMTPCGAAFIGLLLLRQKLTNPAWFGDPNDQNQIWIASPQGPHTGSRARLSEISPAVKEVSARISSGWGKEGSSEAKSFAEFLTNAGYRP